MLTTGGNRPLIGLRGGNVSETAVLWHRSKCGGQSTANVIGGRIIMESGYCTNGRFCILLTTAKIPVSKRLFFKEGNYMSEVINVVALVGSLRRESHNKSLVQTAQSVAPANMNVTIWPLDEIPLYNNDVEVEEGFPTAVSAMREALAAADGIIFATPEYNGSVSGVLKNAIDWASRGGLLADKPVVTMGGSPGALGATKAQEHLRQICLHLGMYVLPRPTIAVPQFQHKIADGMVTDETTQGFIRQQMETFYGWIGRLKK